MQSVMYKNINQTRESDKNIKISNIPVIILIEKDNQDGQIP
jgi:hypothetical protein